MSYYGYYGWADQPFIEGPPQPTKEEAQRLMNAKAESRDWMIAGRQPRARNRQPEPDTVYEDISGRAKAVKAPEPIKIKEYNKQLINNELEKNSSNLRNLHQQITMVKDQMSQEDADDIYGIEDIMKNVHSMIQEWIKIRECLNKELTLNQEPSSVTSRQTP